jgi:hypothetical protein
MCTIWSLLGSCCFFQLTLYGSSRLQLDKQKKYEQWGRENRGVGCGEGFLGFVTKVAKSFAVSVIRGVRSFGYGDRSHRAKVSRPCQL